MGKVGLLCEKVFKKSISNVIIDYVKLQTIDQEIGNILKNRPLCAAYEDDFDNVFTSNHLIFGRKLEMDNVNDNRKLDGVLEFIKERLFSFMERITEFC